MKKNLTNLIYLCLLALTITACNKKEDDVKSLLTGKKWILEKSVYTENGEEDIEITNPAECDSDDYTIYNSNGTITTGTGSKLCSNETTGEKTSAKWSLSSDNKTLTIQIDNCTTEDCTMTYTIEKVTGSNLVLYDEGSFIENGQPIKYTERVYFKI